ncbi:MAG: DNA polymerase I [Lachnospiraceae bacterium]|nr:DNA polymerase I [Lachnospiraceae bacterium]
MEKIVLVDGYSILTRAFFGVPPLTAPDGTPTNAIFGFLNILFKLLEDEKPERLAVAFDVKAPTFRHKMFDAYKGTRKPMPKELLDQVPVLKDLLHAMGVCTVELAGYEADDLLGTLSARAARAGIDVKLVSGDRDMLQLAKETVEILIPKTKGGQTVVEHYYPADVAALYGVTPEEFIDVKALMGDASDNIPGVPGIGEKTAGALIAAYHSIEAVYEDRANIKPPKASRAMEEHYDLAVLSKKLARIETDAPLETSLEETALGDYRTGEALALLRRLGLRTFLARFESAAEEAPKEEKAAFREAGTPEEVRALADSAAALPEAAWIGLWAGALDGDIACFAASLPQGTLLVRPGAQISPEDVRAAFAAILAAPPRKVMLDLKENWPAMRRALGTEEEAPALCASLHDAALMKYLLDPLSGRAQAQEIAAAAELPDTFPSYAELWGKTSPEDAVRELTSPRLTGAAEELPEKELHFCREADVLRRAVPVLMEKLGQTEMEGLYREIEQPLVFVLARMETAGVMADREALRAYSAQLGEHIRALEQEIYEESGEVFNINSPKQLGEILFEKMNLPYGKKTKSGYSTAADVLEKLAPTHPFVGKILEYRTYTKLRSTYAEGLQSYIGPDGRIHGKFHQMVTATGRLSSSDPNLQNIPVRIALGRELRRVFTAPEGCVFLDADYSQIELRILAHMSGDDRLIDAYNSAQDIHALTASQVFHVPLEEVTPELRRSAKAVNFGIVYGISAFGLSENLSISRQEGADYIERYFKTYPRIKAYLDGLVKEAKEKGYVTTLYHRRRPIPELASGNFMQRSFGERAAMNSPIQGTAADIMKIAMLRVDDALRREGLQSRIVLQVHDELLLEVPEAEKEKAAQVLEREMRGAADLKVTLEAEVSEGKNWYEAK